MPSSIAEVYEELERLLTSAIVGATMDDEIPFIKCQVLRITNKRNPLQSLYTINDHVLEKVESEYLGVHIDSKL